MLQEIASFGSRLSREIVPEGWLKRRLVGQRVRSGVSAVLEVDPVQVQYTPDSILQDPRGYQSWNCNGRTRYGTCSGVAWFHEDYVATTNLLGNAIHTYRFDHTRAELLPLQTLREAPTIKKPESIAFSPSGRLAAIADMGAGNIKLFHVDLGSHLLSESPIHIINEGDRTAHGVAFSRCGGFFAYTTIDKPGVIRVYRVEEDDEGRAVRVEPFQIIENTLHPLVPKGIDFSMHDDFVVLCYAPNTTQKKYRDRRGLLTTHAFCKNTGIHSKPLSASRWGHGITFPEDVRLLNQDQHAMLSQQADDSALLVALDPKTGAIQNDVEKLVNPKARLSFPHGIGISPDGRYAAITSYGDDKFGVYAVRGGA